MARQHGVKSLGVEPGIAIEEVAAQPFADVGVQLALHVGGAELAGRLRLGRDRNHCRQVEVEFALNQDAHDAERGAPQAERVAIAGRLFADRKDAGQRVEPVGHGEHLSRVRRRQGIAGETRQVVFADRVGHGARFAIEPRIVLPHRALQVRELPHQPGNQIALRQQRGARDGLGRDIEFGRDPGGERCDPRALVVDAAKAMLVHDLAQRVQA